MEVHKPKLLPRDWLGFLKEYGIIVLGVLTALFAEQAVQSIEWNHKVEVAIAEMSNELSAGDGPQAYTRVAIHDCVTTRLDEIRNAVESGDRGRSRTLIDSFWLPSRTWDSLARESATASDVASHMAHDKMFQFRIAYEMIPAMERLGERELVDRASLRAIPARGGVLETSEKLAALDAVEALRIDNDTMDRESQFILQHIAKVGLGLDRAFVRRDSGEAWPHFTDCLSHSTRVITRS
jgi:hypothetical protein